MSVLLIALCARTANADVAEAKVHYEKGLALYQLGEYRRALDEFKEAHIAKPDPAFLYNIAQCFRQLGDAENALAFYRRYLSAAPQGSLRAEVEKRTQDLEATRAAKAPTTTVAPSSAPPARPRIVMDDSAAAAVATQPSPKVEARRPEPPMPRWVPWVSLGATATFAVVAAVTGSAASTRFDELRGSCGMTPAGCSTGEVDSVRTKAHTANAFWILTGVAAIGTGATVFVNTREAGVAGVWRF
jgi:hypothetical protein